MVWYVLFAGDNMEGTRGGSIAENKRKLRALVEIKRKYLALGENRRQIAEVGSLSQPPKKKKGTILSLFKFNTTS